VARGDYHAQEFLRYVLENLATRCPLCGGEHPGKFFAFAERSYWEQLDGSAKARIVIEVPRLICGVNKQKRRDSGESLQYTLRILPGFLIPHSRVVVDKVHEALESFIGHAGATRVATTLRMGCVNPLSFWLFLQRVRDRITRWLDVLVRLIGELGGEIAEHQQARATVSEPLAAQWKWFHLLVAELVRAYSRLPGTQPILEGLRWHYVYALMSRHQMGLGP